MSSRRDFIKQAALGLGAAAWTQLQATIAKALAIAPDSGTTFLDAEHVVILMQENRSFDHALGALRGIRGFNDPRAITLPGGNPVWVQTNDAGASFVPFRFNIKDTKATWLGDLPHSWTDQIDARNGGRCDRWLQAKASGRDGLAHLPLTLGHYNRDDIPFYYALADAFTVCDQNFCSSLTATTPNRLHLWTGTVRAQQKPDAWANILNSDVDYDSEAQWTTFPERLEANGVSWKVYQNELSLPTGLRGEGEAWLANFTDNPLEWFSQYHVRFAPGHRAFLDQFARELTSDIAALEKLAAPTPDQADEVAKKKSRLAEVEQAREMWSEANFRNLPEHEQQLHAKAFTTNQHDPSYHELAELEYDDRGRRRRMAVPKGDILHQFRADVAQGALPTVSWLVPPERVSDHPTSAWYGAWFLSEVIEILIQNPELWKKTVFILTYDENDGYFDHVPPFVPPHPTQPDTGKVSAGIDPALEYVTREQELTRKSAEESRESPIGLGYRVPMIIASPWSRGGAVCSQVFDHTSVLRFLEVLLSHKTGKQITEPNITPWRRTVCGDLTSAFRPEPPGGDLLLAFPNREEFFQAIHRAQFLSPPGDMRPLTPAEIESLRNSPHTSKLMPQQEQGTRPSAPLPYELAVNGQRSDDRKQLTVQFEARKERFGEKSAGSPFIAYARRGNNDVQIRNYAVSAGDRLEDAWKLDEFPQGEYDVAIYGPNGFFRHFRGGADGPGLDIQVEDKSASTNGPAATAYVEVRLRNRDNSPHNVAVVDNSYCAPTIHRIVSAGQLLRVEIDTSASERWYDLSVHVDGFPDSDWRFAGRVETGAWGSSDPAMGGVVRHV
jgi:phospholipase C